MKKKGVPVYSQAIAFPTLRNTVPFTDPVVLFYAVKFALTSG
jgi:hypothetical protein